MAETKIIPTLTSSLSNQTDLQICSEYLGVTVDCNGTTINTELPNIRLASYFSFDGNLNGVNFEEGELVFNGVNIPLGNDLWLNNDGELIVKGNDKDAFYINEDGELIYDYCYLECHEEYYVCDYMEDNYFNE